MEEVERSPLADWKYKMEQIREEVKRAVFADWISGWSMKDIDKKYELNKVTFYKWIRPTPEQKIEHSVNMWTYRRPKTGRPVGSRTRILTTE